MLLFLHQIALTLLTLFEPEIPHIQQKEPSPVIARNDVKNLMVSSFSWKDCGSGSESIKLKALTVSPDPIMIPGILSLGFNVSNSKDLNSPVSLTLVVKKKISIVWIKIPCEDNIGSCHYPDVCTIVPPTCPESFIKYKIPCKCPINSGKFYLPLSPALNVSGSAIPHWLESGNYDVRVTANDKSGAEVACVDVIAKLKAA